MGKEILIKAVGQAIPTFCMSLFLLPISLVEELQCMLNSFWWGIKANGQCIINWFSWNKLCVRKKYSGMEFKDLH